MSGAEASSGGTGKYVEVESVYRNMRTTEGRRAFPAWAGVLEAYVMKIDELEDVEYVVKVYLPACFFTYRELSCAVQALFVFGIFCAVSLNVESNLLLSDTGYRIFG